LLESVAGLRAGYDLRIQMAKRRDQNKRTPAKTMRDVTGEALGSIDATGDTSPMAIKFKTPEPDSDLKPRIVVFGVGGAGSNAVNNMVEASLDGVEFVVANTDAQALIHSRAKRKIQLGARLTQGLGAGSRPEVGASAAEESLDDIRETLEGAHMVFITAGMGGGTGTGAAPVIAQAARDMGILTVGVVTKPFAFEGQRRARLADDGIARLQASVDTLIVIPNQNLFRVANEKTTFAKAFAMADEVLYSGVRGVTDLMVMPGLINLDFADVRTIMIEMGKAMMGTGEAEGDHRAIRAAEAAISNPLLDHSSMKGARGVLINITGGQDLTLFEVDEAANKIRAEVDPDANIIVGSSFDERLEGKMRVSVVATGIDIEAARHHQSKAQEDAQIEVRPMVASKSANVVHALQAEIAQSSIATPPSDEIAQARKVASQVAADTAIQQSFSPARSAAPAVYDLSEAEEQGPDPRQTARLEAITRTRAQAARELEQAHAQDKKRSPLGFMLDFGRATLGIGGSGRADAEKIEPAQPRGVNRRALAQPALSGVADFGPSPRYAATRQQELRASMSRAAPQSHEIDDSINESGDHLEIPAFLRRQAN
jgi:cell division protein FtsZ